MSVLENFCASVICLSIRLTSFIIKFVFICVKKQNANNYKFYFHIPFLFSFSLSSVENKKKYK